MKKLPLLFVFLAMGFLAVSYKRMPLPENPPNTPPRIQCDSYPQSDFIWPVHHGISLAGSFGELRSDHFHSGLDIRSATGKVGEPLYAAAAGYVSRVKVQASGYGKALYITHPNGYTTVYGHMDRFTEEIETFVKREQYKRHSFEVDLYLPDTLFAFRQNQYIGRMGNRGRSYGPHVHFEIRDTKSEEVINPLCFGLEVHDKVAPAMYRLKVYELDADNRTLNTQTFKLNGRKNHYHPTERQIKVHSPRVAFSLEVNDPQPSGNRNGLSDLRLFAGDSLLWGWHIKRFSFSNTRYANARQDYAESSLHQRRYYRCHSLPGDLLPNTSYGPTNGYLNLPEGQSQNIRIESRDFNGNTASLSFQLLREEGELPQNNNTFNYFLPRDEANRIERPDLQLYFPEGSLYEDLYLNLHSTHDESAEYYSEVYQIQTPEVPLHRPLQIGIRPNRNMDALTAQKAFIAYCRPDGKTVNCGSRWQGGLLFGQYDQLGDYSIQIDTIPPRILPLSFDGNMQGRKRMSFRVYDEIHTARHVPGIEWKAYVDGRWILMEYDPKTRVIYHEFDGTIPPGKHQLVLLVRDALGNEQKIVRGFVL